MQDGIAIVAMLTHSKLPEENQNLVKQIIDEKVTKLAPLHGYVSYSVKQVNMHIHMYQSEADWKVWTDVAATPESKVYHMARKFLSLQMTKCCEKTYAHATNLALLTMQPLSTSLSYHYTNKLKVHVRQVPNGRKGPSIYPGDIKEFKDLYPQLYAEAFAQGEPVPSKVESIELSMLAGQATCRITRTGCVRLSEPYRGGGKQGMRSLLNSGPSQEEVGIEGLPGFKWTTPQRSNTELSVFGQSGSAGASHATLHMDMQQQQFQHQLQLQAQLQHQQQQQQQQQEELQETHQQQQGQQQQQQQQPPLPMLAPASTPAAALGSGAAAPNLQGPTQGVSNTRLRPGPTSNLAALTGAIQSMIKRKPAADEAGSGDDDAPKDLPPKGGAMKAMKSVKTMKAMRSTRTMKSPKVVKEVPPKVVQKGKNPATYDDLKFRSGAVGPRYFGRCTIYSSNASRVWRIKPDKGRRDEVLVSWGTKTVEQQRNWAKVVKAVKSMDKEPQKYLGNAQCGTA